MLEIFVDNGFILRSFCFDPSHRSWVDVGWVFGRFGMDLGSIWGGFGEIWEGFGMIFGEFWEPFWRHSCAPKSLDVLTHSLEK